MKLRINQKWKNGFVLFCCSILTPSVSVYGFHGLFLPAYGARQAGMGGASSAVGGSVMDLENNPAGLSKLSDPLFEGGISLTRATIHYSDEVLQPGTLRYLENDEVFQPLQPMPYTGFAAPVTENLSLGGAFYLQGGGGGKLNNIIRPAGRESSDAINDEGYNSESYLFEFFLARVTVGGAYRIGSLSLGAGLDMSVGYNKLDRSLKAVSGLPDEAEYSSHGLPSELAYLKATGGFHYESEIAESVSGKAGLLYEPFEGLRFSLAYVHSTSLELDGTMRIDTLDPWKMGEIPVKRNLTWPERYTAGVAYETGPLLISADLRYVPWSKSFSRMLFRLDRFALSTPAGIEAPFLLMNLHWKDRPSGAIGLEYTQGDSAYRIGYSYAPTPVVPQGLNPFLGSTTEHHFSAGYGIQFEELSLDLALEYAAPRKIKGSPLSDWAISRLASGGVIQYSRSTSTVAFYGGIRLFI